MNEPAALLELQRIDVEILRAKKRLEDLPEKRAILETRAKMREIASMRDKAKMLVRKLEAEVKSRQDEAEGLAEKINGEQAKIMETTDHRQVASLTREMDGLKRRVDKLEMEELQFMERIEKATAQVATIEEALSKLTGKEAELIERYKEVGGELQKEIAKLEASRAKAAKAVNKPMLERYESTRASKGGIGVGQLVDQSCSACRMTLPAERIKDLTEGPDINTCPECRRIIVVRGGEQQ